MLVTVPTATVTESHGVFPSPQHASFSAIFFADPNLLVSIRSVSPSNTQVILAPPLMPPALSGTSGLASCLPPSLPAFQRTSRARAFAVRAGSLSPVGSAQIQVMGHGGGQVASSLPVTVSPSWKEAVGVDGLRPAQDRGHPPQHPPLPLGAQVSLSDGRLGRPSKVGQSSSSTIF